MPHQFVKDQREDSFIDERSTTTINQATLILSLPKDSKVFRFVKKQMSSNTLTNS